MFQHTWIVVVVSVLSVGFGCRQRQPLSSVDASIPKTSELPDKVCLGCRAASPKEATALMNRSAAIFAKRGYLMSHNCQDAAHYFVRLAKQRKLRAKRLNISCGSMHHAINLLLVSHGKRGNWWCAVEPQVGVTWSKESKSNITESACFKEKGSPDKSRKNDFSIQTCTRYVELVQSEKIVTQDENEQPVYLQPMAISDLAGLVVEGGASHVIFPEGYNPPASTKPLQACALQKRIETEKQCKECCTQSVNSVPKNTKNLKLWQNAM